MFLHPPPGAAVAVLDPAHDLIGASDTELRAAWAQLDRRILASLSIDDVMDALERRMTCLDDPGFCLACGAEADGCEPDARRYACAACGDRMVFGAEEVFLLYG